MTDYTPKKRWKDADFPESGTAPYYRIFHEASGSSGQYWLERKINKAMEHGWSPLGGPFTNSNHLCQAMVYTRIDEKDIKIT